mmetsp:Transcript_19567/g.27311  ORF Transcript_19567/g.27311 Transcript_19567/m.27311 type:complete len:117 (+) Transcript_19567:854-1204(+)
MMHPEVLQLAVCQRLRMQEEARPLAKAAKMQRRRKRPKKKNRRVRMKKSKNLIFSTENMVVMMLENGDGARKWGKCDTQMEKSYKVLQNFALHSFAQLSAMISWSDERNDITESSL